MPSSSLFRLTAAGLSDDPSSIELISCAASGAPDAVQQQFELERQGLIAAAPDAAQEINSIEEGTSLSPAAVSLKRELDGIAALEAESGLRYSVAGRIGTTLETLSQWAGFDWRTNIALVGGFAAKEVVVSTLGTAYSLGAVDPEETGSLSTKLATAPGWRPLTAISLIIFTMFYAPCFVSVVCIAREAGGWRWGAFSMVFNTVLAFSLAVVVFQVGTLLGF